MTQRLQSAFTEFKRPEGSDSPLNLNEFTCAVVFNPITKEQGYSPASTKAMQRCCINAHGFEYKAGKVTETAEYKCVKDGAPVEPPADE